MAKLEYSQIVRRKLKKLRSELTQAYGESGSQKIMGKITKGIRRLEAFPQSGTRISSQYDVESDYSYIFVEHNYFVYRILEDSVVILEIFNEKEDFVYQSLVL